MDKYRDYCIEDFIHDEQFIHWVLKPDEKGDKLFARFQEKYPEKKREIKEAAYLIKALQPIESNISNDDLSRLWLKINQKQSVNERKLFSSILKYAAIFIFFCMVGGLFYLFNSSEEFQPEMAGVKIEKRGQIILSDGSVKYFNTEKTTIHHLSSGLTINDDTIKCGEERYSSSNPVLNHIILPYGMRSEVILSDGTHVFLNSGSKFSYPTKFNHNDRKVYLSGEAFLDVKEDKNKPFYVYTNDVKIKVLGTSFNVSSYSNDQTVQVVLLKGEVSVKKNNFLSKSLDIEPGERAVFNKNDDTLSKDQVDVHLYSSWIYGYLIFEKAPITEVAKKLERYYKRKIEVDKELQNITFSGKLDLNNEIDETIEYISFASSISVLKEKESLTLKP